MVVRPSTRAPKGARVYHVWRGSIRVSFWWRGKWRGMSLPTWGLYDFVRGVPVLLSTRGVRVMPDAPKRPAVNQSIMGASPGAWGLSLPAVSDWLCRGVYSDGMPIGAVQLQIRREGTVVRATLKIADQGGLKVSAIEASPLDAILALDILLSGPDVPWEIDSYPLGVKTPQRKK